MSFQDLRDGMDNLQLLMGDDYPAFNEEIQIIYTQYNNGLEDLETMLSMISEKKGEYQ